MSYQHRSILLSLASSAGLLFWFIPRLLSRLAAGDFAMPDGMQALGWFLITYLGLAVALAIVVNVVGTILLSIASGEKNPEFITDERDHAIELKGLRVFILVAALGLFAVLIGLARGADPALCFALVLLSFTAGDIGSNLAKLAFYGRG